MNKNGFTIFFATLVTSLALAIGLAIYDLTTRELALSATVNQSQYAIYAADTGAECALYWDAKCSAGACVGGSAFATSTETDGGAFPPTSGVLCNSQDVASAGTPPASFALPPAGWTAWALQQTASTATTTFWIALGAVNGPCVKVEVAKSGTPTRTTITSHGYNTCITNASNRVERALQVTY
jgi:hypothetical protein